MSTDSKETGFFRAESGVIFEMDLPLPEVMAYKVTRRELVRVNADGSDYDDHPAMDLAKGEFRAPGKNATKTEWVGYAVSQGMTVDDADAMTKGDLIEKYGEK